MLKKKSYQSEENRFSFAMPIMKCYEQVTMTDAGEVKERFIEGAASSTDIDLHGDKMAVSAIKSMASSIKDHVIGLNAEHDKSWQSELGDVTALSVDNKNRLLMKAKLDITSKANDLWLALTVKKKELGLSIGGFVKDYVLEWDKQKEKFMRVYKDIELDHIAVTSTPANPKTWVGAIAKSISKVERLNEFDFKDMSKEQMAEFLKKSFNCLGEENLNKLLTNFSITINNDDFMLENKKKASLESEEAREAPANSEVAEEEKKDSSELDEEGTESTSENQDNEDEKTSEESEDKEEETEESDEDSEEESEESEEEAEEEKEEEDETSKKASEGDDCEMPDGSEGVMEMAEGNLACKPKKTKKTDSSEEEKEEEKIEGEKEESVVEEKSLTREEVSSIAGEAVQKGLKEFFSTLFKKEEKEEDKDEKVAEKTAEVAEKTAEVEQTPADLLKSILERQDNIEKMLSKKVASRKTIKSVAINKNDEEVLESEGEFKTSDDELAAVKKQYSNDPEKAFIECGKVRRKWAEKESN